MIEIRRGMMKRITKRFVVVGAVLMRQNGYAC
jgi:hypothetical protein